MIRHFDQVSTKPDYLLGFVGGNDVRVPSNAVQGAVVNDLTTGGATIALSAEQGKTLKQAVDGKAAILPAIVLTSATILYRDLHIGRQLINSTSTAVTHTLATDAQAQAAGIAAGVAGGYAPWVAGDSVDMIALGGTTGIPTIATPDGKTMTLTISNIGATCTGSNQWYVGTTAGVSVLAPPDLTRILAFDQFARSDVAPAAGALGVTPFGNRVWTRGNASNGSYGISGGQAYCIASNGFPAALIDCGFADVDITQTITLNGEEARLVGRITTADSSASVCLSLNGNLYYWDGSAVKVIVGFTGFTTGTHTARLVIKGNTATAYIDGQQVATFTYSPGLPTSTFVGFSDLSGKSRFGPIQVLKAA